MLLLFIKPSLSYLPLHYAGDIWLDEGHLFVVVPNKLIVFGLEQLIEVSKCMDNIWRKINMYVTF